MHAGDRRGVTKRRSPPCSNLTKSAANGVTGPGLGGIPESCVACVFMYPHPCLLLLAHSPPLHLHIFGTSSARPHTEQIPFLIKAGSIPAASLHAQTTATSAMPVNCSTESPTGSPSAGAPYSPATSNEGGSGKHWSSSAHSSTATNNKRVNAGERAAAGEVDPLIHQEKVQY